MFTVPFLSRRKTPKTLNTRSDAKSPVFRGPVLSFVEFEDQQIIYSDGSYPRGMVFLIGYSATGIVYTSTLWRCEITICRPPATFKTVPRLPSIDFGDLVRA